MSFKNFIENTSDLSCVQRFSQASLSKPENVLEHCGFASLICLYIGRGLIKEGMRISIGDLLSKAILHDFDEIVTGDISTPVKYHSDEMRNAIAKLERQNMRLIANRFVDPDFFYETWEGAKDGAEGKIVSLADTVCALYKFYDEIVLRGNLSMCRLYSAKIIDTVLGKCRRIGDEFDGVGASSIILTDVFAFCEFMNCEIENKR